jgi:hypothetical protein
MKKNLVLFGLTLLQAACTNMPEQHLCLCTVTKTPSTPQTQEASVAPPAPTEETKQKDTTKVVEESAPPIEGAKAITPPVVSPEHVCSTTHSVCPPTTQLIPYACLCCPQTPNATPIQKSPADACRFDAMPINDDMSPTEILNRTR